MMVLSLHNELARSEGNDMLSLPRLLKSWIALSSGEANRLDSDLACEQAFLFGRASAPRGFAARSRVLARLASLAQIGELARRL